MNVSKGLLRVYKMNYIRLILLFSLSGATIFGAEFAYVTNAADGNVSIIDTATNMVTTTVTV